MILWKTWNKVKREDGAFYVSKYSMLMLFGIIPLFIRIQNA